MVVRLVGSIIVVLGILSLFLSFYIGGGITILTAILLLNAIFCILVGAAFLEISNKISELRARQETRKLSIERKNWKTTPVKVGSLLGVGETQQCPKCGGPMVKQQYKDKFFAWSCQNIACGYQI
jgi:hypothetical protein